MRTSRRASSITSRPPPNESGAFVGVDVPGAAQDRLRPEDEFARAERLRQVVVGSELETVNPVLAGCLRGEHQDWHLRERA